MTTPFEDQERPRNPYPNDEKEIDGKKRKNIPNIGRHPIDRLMQEQHEKLFVDWENGERVDKWVEWWKNSSGSGNGPKKDKRSIYMDNTEPLFLMTTSEPKKGLTRSWGNLRRDSLAAPNGYEEGHIEEGPLVNWAYFKQSRESWNRIKNYYLSESEADRAVVNWSLKCLDKGFFSSFYNSGMLEGAKGDGDTVVTNPPDVARMFSDKMKTYNHLKDHGLPAIPTEDAEVLFYDGREELQDRIGNPVEGYVVKPTSGSSGNGVRQVADADEALDLLTTKEGIRNLIEDAYDEDEQHKLEESIEEYSEDPESFVDSYVIQQFIPHDSDVRTVRFGDTVANAERRIAGDDDLRTNLSQVSEYFEGRKLTVYGEVLNAMTMDPSEGGLESIDVGHLEDGPNPGDLGKGLRELTDSIVNSFDSDEYRFNSNLDQPPIKVGIDALEADYEDVKNLPDRWLDPALDYADGETLYFVPELNGNPGTGIDVAATLEGRPEQLTPIHAHNFMRDLAGLDTYEISDVVGNEDMSTPEGRLYSRVRSYFPGQDMDKNEWIDHVGRNLRPSDREDYTGSNWPV